MENTKVKIIVQLAALDLRVESLTLWSTEIERRIRLGLISKQDLGRQLEEIAIERMVILSKIKYYSNAEN